MPTRANERRPVDRLLTAADVARAYGVRVETVREWIRKGIMGHVLVGPFHAVRVPVTEAARHFRGVAGAKL